MRRATIAACACLALALQGQQTQVYGYADDVQPKAVVTGPTEGSPGDLIELDFSESVCDKMKVFVNPSKFSDGRPTFKMSKDGTSCALASRASTVFTVEVIVSNSQGPDRTVFTVTIASYDCPKCPDCPAPAPSPKPDVPPPPPKPDVPPPLPADKFGLAEFVRSQVLASIPPEKRYLCTQFSGNYNQVKVSPFTSWNDAMAKLKALNVKTEGPDKALWDKVFTPISAKLQQLVQAKTLDYTNLAEVKVVLDAIANGFAGGAAAPSTGWAPMAERPDTAYEGATPAWKVKK